MAEENKIFTVEIITPDRIFYKGEGDMIEFTTAVGEIGVYKKHIPLTTVLAPGVVKIHKTGEDDVIAAVHSGFAEILPDKVTLLAENAGKVITYESIIKDIWGPHADTNNRILRVNMANIRRKIEKNPAVPKYVFTEVGVGYRMLENELNS